MVYVSRDFTLPFMPSNTGSVWFEIPGKPENIPDYEWQICDDDLNIFVDLHSTITVAKDSVILIDMTAAEAMSAFSSLGWKIDKPLI
jgi:hypothetical protein